MSQRPRAAVHAAGLPAGGRPRRAPLGLAVVVAAAATVAVGGGGDAFWLCLPWLVPAVAAGRTRLGAALGGAGVVGSSALVAALWDPSRPLPSWLLVVSVPAATAVALGAWRERVAREREALRGYALSDGLTGIPNRTMLLARAEYEIARHRRSKRSFTVLMLDLDGFKAINDRFGHATGDDLLRDVAGALERSRRAQDTAARLGGDEFCVLAPETDEVGSHRLAARVAQAVAEVTAGADRIEASIGVAVFPTDGANVEELMHEADRRLLSAKRARPGRGARRRAA